MERAALHTQRLERDLYEEANSRVSGSWLFYWCFREDRLDKNLTGSGKSLQANLPSFPNPMVSVLVCRELLLLLLLNLHFF